MPSNCSVVRALAVCALVLTMAANAAAASRDSATADQGPIDYATARRDRKLPATRAGGIIELDGRLDEPSWATAPLAKDFIQNDPREGEPATFDTEVRLVYDDDALYIGVFAKDDKPSGIIINELRKDFNTGNGDGFQVIIDTFLDERNGYQFAINPAGAKWDSQMSNEGRENNSNWDGIWDVRTRIGEAGWYAEMRIPFRTLKFSPADLQTWGINFQRRLRRLNENSYWSPLQRIHQLSRVSMAGTLEGLRGLRPGANLRVKPYGLVSGNRLASGGVDGDADAGVDVKYGVTSGLTWDFTVNTDFSQVEADEQQINLTRFSLFFPEKRDFFLENSGVFQFGAGNERGGGGGGGGGGRQNASQDMILFFSRRIGLADSGDAIPILGGTRLTGRVGGFSIGALNIQQRRQAATPSTNYTALRVRRDILGNSDVGVMFLNKDAGALYNRAAGLDGNFRFFRDLTVNLAVAKTESPQVKLPGSGGDWYSKSSFGFRNDFWELRGAYQTIGNRFNDELGFVPRTGVNNGEFHVGTHIRPKWARKWLRETYPHFQIENFTRRQGLGLESRYMDWHWPITLQNSTFVEVGVNPNVEMIRRPFTINSRRSIQVVPGRYEFYENFVLWRTNGSAPLAFNGRYSIGDFYGGYRRGYELGSTVRVNEHFNVSGNVAFNDISLPQGAFTTTLLSGRVNYFFNTKVFLNALLQYNTDARQWSSNVRLNIIHRPLSDLFLVYNERHDSQSGLVQNRALIAKMTYLIAF
ncbi:MAG TPA: DUF5916 domain-containing protein [Vicinamibacterales bacterium]|nr:DUF5916 domain-containing protein [Vicinamibacterales bacterium]